MATLRRHAALSPEKECELFYAVLLILVLLGIDTCTIVLTIDIQNICVCTYIHMPEIGFYNFLACILHMYDCKNMSYFSKKQHLGSLH